MKFRGRDGARLIVEFKNYGWIVFLTIPAALVITLQCILNPEWNTWTSAGSAACAGLGALTVIGDYFLPPGPSDKIVAPNLWRTAGAGIIAIMSVVLGISAGVPPNAIG